MPHVSGPQFLRYGESLKTAKLQASHIVAAGPLFRSLRNLAPNLSFTDTSVRSALAAVCEGVGRSWGFTAEEADAWCCSMSKRIRIACRHIAQTELKRPQTPWLVHVQKEQRQETPAAASAEAPLQTSCRRLRSKRPSPVEANVNYIVGWDQEQHAAWRTCDGSGGRREFTKVLHSNGKPYEPVVAEWPDGYQHAVEELSNEDWQLMEKTQQSKRQKTARNRAFEAIQDGSGSLIHVRYRMDRIPLLAIDVDKKQVLQIRADCDAFENEKQVLEWLIGVAVRLQHNEIAVGDLYNIRNEMIAAARAGTQQVAASKRPAPSNELEPVRKAVAPSRAGAEDAEAQGGADEIPMSLMEERWNAYELC